MARPAGLEMETEMEMEMEMGVEGAPALAQETAGVVRGAARWARRTRHRGILCTRARDQTSRANQPSSKQCSASLSVLGVKQTKCEDKFM